MFLTFLFAVISTEEWKSEVSKNPPPPFPENSFLTCSWSLNLPALSCNRVKKL